MTKKEILDETVEFYSNNPRSFNADHFCVYNGLNGEKCAFSRCTVPLPEWVDGRPSNPGYNASDLLTHKELGPSIMLPEYEGHEPNFWDLIQQVHDSDENWVTSGLSEHGIKVVDRFLQAIEDNEILCRQILQLPLP